MITWTGAAVVIGIHPIFALSRHSFTFFLMYGTSPLLFMDMAEKKLGQPNDESTTHWLKTMYGLFWPKV